jgi:hypothetical protein
MVLTGLGCSSPAVDKLTPAWKQVWADNFGGPPDGPVNTSNWEFNTGRGIFGTGEIETMTSSPYNAHLGGRGNLDLIVLGHGAAGSPGAAWTSARIRTKMQFGAPTGGEMMVTASIKHTRLPTGAICSSGSVRTRHAYATAPITAATNSMPPHSAASRKMVLSGVTPCARLVVMLEMAAI